MSEENYVTRGITGVPFEAGDSVQNDLKLPIGSPVTDFELAEYWDITKECWRVGRATRIPAGPISKIEPLTAREELAALWKVFEMKSSTQENQRLREHLDRITEYLRHGPNCPADFASVKIRTEGKCDCGLNELLGSFTLKLNT